MILPFRHYRRSVYKYIVFYICQGSRHVRKQEGEAAVYTREDHTIYREHTLYRETASKQVIPDHTYLYRPKPAQNPIYRPKTAHIWWIYRFSPTYSQILVLLVGIIDFSREQSFLPIAPGL